MKYHLIDMANISESQLSIVDRTFKLWKSVYQEELKSRNLDLPVEDFWSCKILAVLDGGDEIIGAHIYNVYDLRTCAIQHKYFNDVQPERIEQLKSQGINKLMTMEYLLVNPLFRGKSFSVRWAEVIIGLGFRAVKHSPWQAGVGIARVDKKVHEMGIRMGCAEAESVTKNQTPCRFMVMSTKELLPHENPATQQKINSLWLEAEISPPWVIHAKPLEYAA